METLSEAPLLKPLVLLVDDEPNTTLMLQYLFEREGFAVERRSNGTSAIEYLLTNRPDLILLDIRMPDIDGFEVLEKLRNNPQTATIPIILLTANARHPSEVVRGLKLGADDYIYKPFVPQELLARARSKIQSRKLEENLYRRTRELELLLQASERLNQHLTETELINTVYEFVQNLIPSDFILIVRIMDDGSPLMQRCTHNDFPVGALLHDMNLESQRFTRFALEWNTPEEAPALLQEYTSGMVMPLSHGISISGFIIVASARNANEPSRARLLEGFARQASLALRNTQLYAIQAFYAMQLEDMVTARTAELENTHKMLIRSEKLASIGHLAASIAHEINNPLMPIANLIDDFVEDLDERGIAFDHNDIEVIRQSLERIRGIVRRLLEFSRDSGPDMRLLNVNDLVNTIITLNSRFFQHSRVTVETHLAELPLIHGSKDQLEQVLMNIALNAQAAMPTGGLLTITSRLDKNDVLILFTDTGIGIPHDQMNKIFEPFYSTKPSGTGLGLFVSYGIIQAHHGAIEVSSVVGKGTTFIIRLPIHRAT
jgi:signal transduction histidine kinase